MILEENYRKTTFEFKKMEFKLTSMARIYEVDKFKLHIKELDMITSLIIGLEHRLEPVERSLDNLEWNGAEERHDLEKKRLKLHDQLEDAHELWCSINNRTELVANYIEQYLSEQEAKEFHQLVRTRIKQIATLRKTSHNIDALLRELKVFGDYEIAQVSF